MANKLIPIAIREKLVKELYYAGMNMMLIGKTLDLATTEVRDILGDLPITPSVPYDEKLINKLLYDSNIPVATDVIIENEKARYLEYSSIEKKCLVIMNRLLEYYMLEGPSGDATNDAKIASIVTSFIKSTQDVRQELLKKYEIDQIANSKDDNKIQVEFIE